LGKRKYAMRETLNNSPGAKGAGPVSVIGLFLAVFGVAVLFGILFTETNHGIITNLICGGTIFLVGVGAIFYGRIKR
jgi:hypothetical protein